MEQISLDWSPTRHEYTVAELTSSIRNLLSEEYFDIRVRGEISGVRHYPSGHVYFTLKDSSAQLRCVSFKSSLRLLRVKPADGLAVLARGSIDVYEARGEYQLIVDALEPQGAGDLFAAFEQLKKRLEAEGLFDAARKRPLPRFPNRIGIVTSPAGAVIRDMMSILSRRFPGLHIRLYPAQVQGPGSAASVVEGITYFSRSGWPDLLIVGRGGGSIEDLWTFNEEAVARAIAACPVPVISAVGHETDFTIADFVADLRAPTPSAAAELAVPLKSALFDQIGAHQQALVRSLRLRLARLRNRVEQLGVDRASASLGRRLARLSQLTDDLGDRARERLRLLAESRRRRLKSLDLRLRAQDPTLRLHALHRRLDQASQTLRRALDTRLALARRRLDPLAAALVQLSPLTVLERGYAIVESPPGRILRSAAETVPGQALAIRLHRGRLEAAVTRTLPPDDAHSTR